jgi:DNA-directed RNA polymerase specialized sigma24 family protein
MRTINSHHHNAAEAVRAAVCDLPERYRSTVDLHYFAGLSQHDTAKALGLNEDAVAKRLQRARDCLRTLLMRRGITVSGGAVLTALATVPAHAAPQSLYV